MGETKKIVVEGFPVEQLPEAVRGDIERGQRVRVTVELTEPSPITNPRRTMRSFLGSAPGLYESPQQVVEYIRALRDESDR